MPNKLIKSKNPPRPNKKAAILSLRLPPDLYEMVRLVAFNNRASINKTIVEALQVQLKGFKANP